MLGLINKPVCGYASYWRNKILIPKYELVQTFKDSVDEYLELCKEVGKEPMKPFKGSFNVRVRVGKELHKKAFQVATSRHISLNQLVQEALEKEAKGFEHT